MAKFLRRVPLFESWSRTRMLQLCRVLHPYSYKAGEVIVEQGDSADHFFILRKGVCHVMKERHSYRTNRWPEGLRAWRTRRTLVVESALSEEIRAGEYFGEGAILTGAVRARGEGMDRGRVEAHRPLAPTRLAWRPLWPRRRATFWPCTNATFPSSRSRIGRSTCCACTRGRTWERLAGRARRGRAVVVVDCALCRRRLSCLAAAAAVAVVPVLGHRCWTSHARRGNGQRGVRARRGRARSSHDLVLLSLQMTSARGRQAWEGGGG